METLRSLTTTLSGKREDPSSPPAAASGGSSPTAAATEASSEWVCLEGAAISRSGPHVHKLRHSDAFKDVAVHTLVTPRVQAVGMQVLAELADGPSIIG